jgi:hypothetical protein
LQIFGDPGFSWGIYMQTTACVMPSIRTQAENLYMSKNFHYFLKFSVENNYYFVYKQNILLIKMMVGTQNDNICADNSICKVSVAM